MSKPAFLVEEMEGSATVSDAHAVLDTVSRVLGSARNSVYRVLLQRCLSQHCSFGFNQDGIPSACLHVRFDTFMGSTTWRRQGSLPMDGTPLRFLNLSHLGEIYGLFFLCVEGKEDETEAHFSCLEFHGTPSDNRQPRSDGSEAHPADGLCLTCMAPPSQIMLHLDKRTSTGVCAYTASKVMPPALSTPCIRRERSTMKLCKVGEMELPFETEPMDELVYCRT
jgi:hypothetical protein